MSLSLLHGGIAVFGLTLAAIPIILHFLLRQKPRPILFPALRLIENRRTITVKKLRLRHWILLALRILLLSLLGLALARPTLHSSLFSIDQKAPVSAVLIFDASLSMQYKHHGKTRLEEAKKLAEDVIHELPDNSEVLVIDSSEPAAGVPMEPATALSRVKDLQPQPVPRVINDSLSVAYKALAKSQQTRREIYIFSDLALDTFSLGGKSSLDQLAEQVGVPVRIYVINVGIEKSEDIAIDDVHLSQQVLAADSKLEITAHIRNSGPIADRTVELTLDGQARDNKPIRLPAGEAAEASFSIPNLTEGIHQGRISISGGDPMPFNDVEYFTVEVRPAVKMLVATDSPADGVNWINALTPAVNRRSQRSSFIVESIDSRKLEQTELAPFAVVCLLNVGSLKQEAWIKLSDFVQAGGGVFIAMGERVDAAAYNTETAQAVMPGKVGDEVNKPEGIFLAPDKFTHPVLQKFRLWGDNDMSILPIFRYRLFKPLATGSVVVAPYNNSDPALIERTFGQGKRGRVMLLSTAAFYRPSGDIWTELPLGWSYVVLADQISRHLSGLADTKLNYLAGNVVAIDLNPAEPFSLFSITDPEGRIERLAVDPRESMLTIPSAKLLGHYKVDASENGRLFGRGFSVNEPNRESVLTPIDVEELRKLLGPERTAIAREPSKLDEVVDQARVGRELFPWIMFLVLCVITAEGYIANRFYKQPK